MSNLIADLLGRRDFYSKARIIPFVNNSKHFDSGSENLQQAEAILIFSTSKQRTWIVSTNERLYCILDDNRKDMPNINWSIPKRDLIINEEVSINITTNENYKEKTGLINFGQKHKNWLYSKKLFNKVDIKTSIIHLILSFNLKTTSYFREKKQPEFWEKNPKLDGRKLYDIRLIIDSEIPSALELVDHVEYFLPGYPKTNRNPPPRNNYKDKFLLKELAYGGSTVYAKVFLKGEEESIEFQNYISLEVNGPRFIRGLIIKPNANLKLVNLSKTANLIGADMTGANLTGADLSESDLTGADMTGANLTGADLSESDLTGADLKKANLMEAKLNNITLDKTNLEGTDLRAIKINKKSLNSILTSDNWKYAIFDSDLETKLNDMSKS